MQMLRLFYSQKVWTFSNFICSNHTAKGWLNFLIFSFIPELDAVSCFFHFQCVIQFWELLKNSPGIVKILGMGPNFPILIYPLLCPQLHMTAIDICCVPFVFMAEMLLDVIGLLQTFLQVSFKQAEFFFINIQWS